MKPLRLHKLLTTLFAAALMGLGASVSMAPSVQATTPGTPGTTQPGTVVFSEDFEHGTDNMPLGARSYSAPGSSAYTGAGGQTYTGSPEWINASRCNGVILSYDNTITPDWAVSGTTASGTNNRCAETDARSFQFLRMLAKAMGQQFTPDSATTNHVDSSYTECPSTSTGGESCDVLPAGPTHGVMFKTNTPIPTTPGHYYTFGVDTAYMNCGSPSADPAYQFARSDANGVVRPIGDAINGCRSSTDPNIQSFTQQVTSNVGGNYGTVTRTVHINSVTSNEAFQAATDSLGLQMWNTNGATNGNDGAFDNVRLVDVTPQLDTSFTPSLIGPGQTSTLTLTITNTSELNAKNDWSVTDTLPEGLVVASAPNLGGTCVQQLGSEPFVTTAEAGGNVISMTGGDLAAHMESCSITVDVTASMNGTYVIGPSNLLTNLNPPADAPLVVKAPKLELRNALDSPRLQDADQFTMEIRKGSPAGPVVSNTAHATTAGVGSTITLGTGVTGEYIAEAGSALYLTESGNNLSGYDKTIACVDASGLQPGLPSGAVFSGSLTLALVAGADIDCVLTNKANIIGAMEFSKAADASMVQSPAVVGDRITYTFTAKNTGNAVLRNVSIDDPLAGLSALMFDWPGRPGELLPGQSVTATASYAITQSDIVAGHVANSATTTGTPPAGPPLTPPPCQTDTVLNPGVGVQFSKTADASGVGDPVQAGDAIVYRFTLKNTGDVPLTGVGVNDQMPGLSSLVYSGAGAAGTLLAGETMTASATYVITQADLTAGMIANTATVTATLPTGTAVTSPPANVLVSFPAAASGVSGGPQHQRPHGLLAESGVVLTVVPLSVLVGSVGVFLFLGGRRQRTARS
ncbi:DUF7507 domain-containing protein [Paenarthrobacter nitroguajacolicus]|uniref:DUF7507 domain-containing protein n=1 Tax=Paenarthrobacter nitroguajacolicus TaxID=211146 RepID=UPI004053F074